MLNKKIVRIPCYIFFLHEQWKKNAINSISFCPNQPYIRVCRNLNEMVLFNCFSYTSISWKQLYILEGLFILTWFFCLSLVLDKWQSILMNLICRGEGQVHCGQLINVKYFFEDDDLSFNHKVYSSNAYNITSIIHDWSHCISFLFIISNDTNNILNVWFIIQSFELCHSWFSWLSLIHA